MKTMHQLFLIVTIYSWSFFCKVKACGVVVFLGALYLALASLTRISFTFTS